MNFSESEFILNSFRSNFSRFQKEPIVLYGIGENTRLLLNHFDDFRIVGLMDPNRIGDSVMGLPVFSPAEVAKQTKIIIIVARINVVGIIYRRIASLETEYGIQIYDVSGNRPGQCTPSHEVVENTYWKQSAETLKTGIDEHDIISFDVFDTLVTRELLHASDIFDIVAQDENAPEKFRILRDSAERELILLGPLPNLERIYEYIQLKTGIGDDERQYLLELEQKTEARFLIPRTAMLEWFRYALAQGKRVYLLSDMYFGKVLQEELLRACGITGYCDLLVSCDYNRTKQKGDLFPLYKELAGEGRFLHIGDNPLADGEMPRRYGIDSYRVFSPGEMLLNSSCRELLVKINSVEERRLLGFWTAHAFNDPFVLHKGNGKPVIDDFFELGYFYIAPILLCFMGWLVEELKQNDYRRILFFARDGYLIKQLYQMLRTPGMPQEIYLRTSRRAASVASIHTTEDILQILKKPFSCRLGELLYRRFGIKPSSDDMEKEKKVTSGADQEQATAYIFSYRDAILRNAAEERECYLAYFRQLEIGATEKLAVFDFVSSGTTQYFMERLLKSKLDGYYFATANLPNDFYRVNDIRAFLGNSLTFYAPVRQAEKYYLLLESILTSPDGPMSRVLPDGTFAYNQDCEPGKEWNALQRCHDGIKMFVRDYLAVHSSYPGFIDKADEIFGLLISPAVSVTDGIRDAFTMESNYDFTPEYKVWTRLS